MMKSIFLSPAHIQSPRWLQAFPSAQTLHAEAELPINLQETLIWAFVTDEFIFDRIATWVAAGARVIALTNAEDAHQAKLVLEMGASGYLHYLAALPVLLQVSQVVDVGGLWLGVELMRELVFTTASILKPAPEKKQLDLLSVREQDVAKAVAVGKSNKEVARELDITERTVKAHLSAVFEKLQVRDRLHLVLVMSGHR